MKLKISPLFLLLALYFIVTGQATLFCGYMLCIIVHEAAHGRMAVLRGYKAGTITLMPYGGVLESGEEYSKADNILIALAGPSFNLIFAALIVALWWLIPDIYDYTLDLCLANVAMGLINLLPAYPLDGGRIISCSVKNKRRAYTALKISGIAIGAVMTLLCVASIFFGFNLSLGVFGALLVCEAVFGAKEETFLHLTAVPFSKDYDLGVESVVVAVSASAPLSRLLAFVKTYRIVCFEIVDADGRKLFSLDEKAFGELCVRAALSDSVEKAYAAHRRETEDEKR